MKRLIVGWLETLSLGLFGLLILVCAIVGYTVGDGGGLIGGLVVGVTLGVVVFGGLFILLEMNQHLRQIRLTLSGNGSNNSTAPVGFPADGPADTGGSTGSPPRGLSDKKATIPAEPTSEQLSNWNGEIPAAQLDNRGMTPDGRVQVLDSFRCRKIKDGDWRVEQHDGKPHPSVTGSYPNLGAAKRAGLEAHSDRQS